MGLDRRLKLHAELVEILGIEKNVHFQPPETVKLKYPCIIYKRSNSDSQFADNKTYLNRVRYDVTLIDSDPDSDLPDKMIAHFPLCTENRAFTNDNLNHFSFNLYY